MANRDTRSPRRRLTRDDWADAALAAIADGGLAAVAVEPLAARLRTTKGSFYWHFANREALLEAALARWEDQTTTAVIGEIVNATDDPAGRLRRLIIRVIENAERDRVELALLANAGHPAVQPAVDRVTRARIGLLVTVFSRLGLPPPEVQSRALLAYSAYLGHTQLAHATPQMLPASAEGRRAYLDHLLRMLSAAPTSAAEDGPAELQSRGQAPTLPGPVLLSWLIG